MSDNHSNQPTDKKPLSFADAEKIRQELNALPIQCDDTDKDIDEKSEKEKKAYGQDAAKGLAASMQVISGVMVGGFLGYGFDYIFHTLPFGTVIMIPIGMLAGFRNMIRSLESDTDIRE